MAMYKTARLLLACLACASQGRRTQSSTQRVHQIHSAESSIHRSSARVNDEGGQNPLKAFAALLFAANPVAAFGYHLGSTALERHTRLSHRVPSASMEVSVSVARQLAVNVPQPEDPKYSVLEYVRLPAKEYNLLDSNNVQRLENDTFMINMGLQNFPMLGEFQPEAMVNINAGERGVAQTIQGIQLKPAEGKKLSVLARQVNKISKAIRMSNIVAALPGGELTSRLSLDATFKEGIMAKAPQKQLSAVMNSSLLQMMPWFLTSISKDYAKWSAGKSRSEGPQGDMSTTMREVLRKRGAGLPAGMQELPVMDMTELIGDTSKEPALLRAARGERVERTPVWMMRQAGRHMAVYRALVDKYPTFRERSETPEVSKAVSLQPWEAYGTDGVILFSDILTPLPAMGVDFSISEAGGISIEPIRTREAFKRLSENVDFNPARDVPFVGSVLGELRQEVAKSGATVLGFVGLPFTLGTYLIEGATGTKNGFAHVRELRASDPELCHDILSLLARNIAQYAIYQIDSGAQVIQVFDSWAGHLEPEEFDEWAAPYQKQVVAAIKEKRPDVPVIIYMAPDTHSKNGQLLTRLAGSGADVVSVDHTIDIAEAKRILSEAGYPDIGLQGNLDPEILRDGPPERIVAETERILKAAGNKGHVMNLGHGIEATTPEPYAELFVNTVHNFKHSKSA